MAETKIPTREELMERLEMLPKAMRTAEENMLRIQDEIDSLDLKIKNVESRIKKGVIEELEDGKPKFKNEASRQMAIETRTNQDKEHKDLRGQITEKIKESKEAKIGYSFMDRKFKAVRTMAQLIGGEKNE